MMGEETNPAGGSCGTGEAVVRDTSPVRKAAAVVANCILMGFSEIMD